MALNHAAVAAPVLHLPGCDVVQQRDAVAAFVRDYESNWSFDHNDGRDQIPLGDLDEQAWSAVRHALKAGRSLAFAVPRVEPGLSIGPAIALAIGAMLQKKNLLKHARDIPLEPGQRIALAGRLHVTRHLFAESVLRFHQTATRLCAFPTERLDRKARLDPGVYGRILRKNRQEPIEDNIRVEIYDLGPLPQDVDVPKVEVVIAELYEHDNDSTVARLTSFARRSRARSTIVFVNALDRRKLEQLAALGFGILPMRSFEFDALKPMPSLFALDRAAPAACAYETISVSVDEPAALALAQAHFRLVDALGACGDEPRPAFLRQAWYVLNTLSAVAVPLVIYERARQDLGRPRIAAEIERLRTPRALHDERRVAQILMAGWTHVVDALQAAYDELARHNPLAALAIERIKNEAGDLVVALADRANRDALFGELVIAHGWKSDSVVVEHLARLSRTRVVAPRVLTIGVDGLHRNDPALWSLLPDCVEAMTYPHAVRRHLRWIDGCNEQLNQVLPAMGFRTARSLWGEGAVTPVSRSAGHVAPDIAPPDLTQLRMRQRLAEERAWTFVPASGVHRATDPEDEDLLADDPDEIDEHGGLDTTGRDRIRVQFTDGGFHAFSPSAEVLVVEDEDVEPRRVAALEPGDEILYLADDEHRSAFEAIRERTSHLVEADDRVMEWWRSSMRLLRRRYPPEDPVTRDRFFRDAVGRGCEKEEQTMVSWLLDTVMAPRDRVDIETVLALGGAQGDVALLARRVHREVTTIRTFCRQLGQRFRTRMAGRPPRVDDSVGSAIEEFLDEAEHRVVAAIELPT